MWKRSFVVVLVTTVALALWAYHTNTDQPDNPQATDAAATVSADTTRRHNPDASTPPPASPSESGAKPTPTPRPEPTTTAAPTELGTPAHQDTEAPPADALDTVTRFATAYLAPDDKTSKQWASSLTPLVTKELANSLATVDMSNVPSGTVTTVDASSSSEVAITTTVETSAGQMLILTTWSGTRWEISRYTAPEN